MRHKSLLAAAVVTVLLLSAAAWLRYDRVWRWRSLESEVRAYLQSARAGDTAEIQLRSLEPEAAMRVLTMARLQPDMLDTLIASLTLTYAGYSDDHPQSVVAFFRTRSTFCRFADGTFDQFQVTAQATTAGWRFEYASITPC